MEKADQFIAKISANEVASSEKFSIKFLGLIETLAVIGVTHSLPERSVVIHRPDAVDQIVIEVSDPHYHTTFLGPSDGFPSFLRKAFPPLIEADQMNCGDTLPLHSKRIFRSICGRLLGERENVGLYRTALIAFQLFDVQFGSFELILHHFLAADHCRPKPFSSSEDLSPIHIQ
ncbi:MAG: hypothetical protein WA772_13185 [Candidatus Acidiferrales bacterium]